MPAENRDTYFPRGGMVQGFHTRIFPLFWTGFFGNDGDVGIGRPCHKGLLSFEGGDRFAYLRGLHGNVGGNPVSFHIWVLAIEKADVGNRIPTFCEISENRAGIFDIPVLQSIVA